MPALILHDTHRKINDTSEGPSHRSVISLRIRQAEAGLWLPLVDDLLQAHIDFQQQDAPKKPTWKTRCSRAVYKSLSGSWSLAFRALQEDNCPVPSQETFDKVAQKFICTEISAQEQDILFTAATKARRNCNKHLTHKITHRAVANRIRQLRLASHPGCTKARNTHIASLLKTLYGVQAARLWVLAWARGNVPQHVANLWLIGQVKPLSKKSGTGVRPITVFEMLLKPATGVILDVSKADVIQAVGPYQYGAMMQCGADRMVYNLRSMALAAPHKLFIATDIQNAFGTVNRATAVGALLMYLPAFVPIMSLFWGSLYTALYIPNSHSSFAQLKVTQGVFQGECISTAVFCTHLRVAIDHFLQQTKCLFPDRDPTQVVQFLAYVDDVVLIMEPSDFLTLWPVWVPFPGQIRAHCGTDQVQGLDSV